MKYIVMVTIPFGIDDTYYCEYSGIEHKTREEANKELINAVYEHELEEEERRQIYNLYIDG